MMASLGKAEIEITMKNKEAWFAAIQKLDAAMSACHEAMYSMAVALGSGEGIKTTHCIADEDREPKANCFL